MGDERRDSERRRAVRHFACFPAHIREGEGVQRTAIIRDLSVTGALLLTRARLKVGAQLSLALYVTNPEQPHAATGKVLRAEHRVDGVLWPYLVAVHFDTPLNGLEPEIQALAAHQANIAKPRARIR